MGYHVMNIPRGEFGEFSKIEEEFLELKDALNQNIAIMALCEMADLIGAIEAYAKKYGMTLNDLLLMKEVTARAFLDGSRS